MTEISKLSATVCWAETQQGPAVRMIDQTRLPGELVLKDCRTVEEVCEAIKVLRVRGHTADAANTEELRQALTTARDELAATRPTAVNLFWALDRMMEVADQATDLDVVQFRKKLLDAQAIVADDLERCRRIGENGAQLIADGANILTHCNAGALATAGYGTALGVIRAAHEQGKDIHVWVDETRPLLQGARLTAWELHQEGIACTVISDSVGAALMGQGRVDCIVVGADRIAANGDTANKIGTYMLSVLADYHDVPFYVAAPFSTVDFDLPSGEEIPIEQRSPREVSLLAGRLEVPICPEGVDIYNPAFDVTPHQLITAIITERGIAEPPFSGSLRRL